MSDKYSLQEHFDLTKIKLKEAKFLINLFVFDYDGTVRNGVDYEIPEVIALTEKILSRGRLIAFVTARAATAFKTLVPPLRELLNRIDMPVPVFIAGGNGVILHKMTKDESVEIYNHGLTAPQILRVVEIGKKIYEELNIGSADPSEKGLATLGKFLKENWEDYIPSEIIDICRSYKGRLFAEKSKVTFVLPKDKSLREKVVSDFNEKLNGEYQASMGDDTYVHITRKLEEDGKVVAVKTILKSLNLKLNQAATFGDTPLGNDAGLLNFPYSFTNSEEFIKVKNNFQQPPYILERLDLSPVARIYRAVDYLIEG